MSLTQFCSAGSGAPASKITFPFLEEKKRAHVPITALTAYDYATARLVDEAGVDMILVGDSLAMVVMGHDNTLAVTVDEMLHHTRAVRRAVQRSLVVADMPFGSYHVSVAESVANAVRFVKEGGAAAVKIEGGATRCELVERLTDAEIPVVCHMGLTPQAVHRMGGYKVQGKTAAAAEVMMRDARMLEAAGAAVMVLEGVPREVAEKITSQLRIPTIGIGAGPGCDGQILVFHDLVNLSFSRPAKFVRQYADGAALFRGAIESYVRDVESGAFPSEEESYHLTKQVAAALDLDGGGDGTADDPEAILREA
ncbi:3-methyl-2-oxobutanoate hydroxymethyltransferase [Silvibacterium dinghuense]|uniref:3-methyl-2-oxobutanoate hydroxymethyltransferase n=1 Tax=Silvibacterium dinghuense TaxID=1560006 RepID=A0A4Q1SAU7_9BACT|nr:3-methyl-2-oxobutanoate hydroxymethyltransferase [Silvibacterium dinghuense]RXS93812.1 3-methyl-2-oxobutanoate hydroxymethyltransferase [Silvibacterium dinghuense]GGH07884.1 3-methyl-2-oxobutanoate hydroxymethyltransferase [Silvibacterium dinghuense]